VTTRLVCDWRGLRGNPFLHEGDKCRLGEGGASFDGGVEGVGAQRVAEQRDGGLEVVGIAGFERLCGRGSGCVERAVEHCGPVVITDLGEETEHAPE
jgi:hypothetical protein